MMDFLKLDNYTVIGKREVMDCILPRLITQNIKIYTNIQITQKDGIYALSRVNKNTFVIEEALYSDGKIKNFDSDFISIESSLLDILVNEEFKIKNYTQLIVFNVKELQNAYKAN